MRIHRALGGPNIKQFFKDRQREKEKKKESAKEVFPSTKEALEEVVETEEAPEVVMIKDIEDQIAETEIITKETNAFIEEAFPVVTEVPVIIEKFIEGVVKEEVIEEEEEVKPKRKYKRRKKNKKTKE